MAAASYQFGPFTVDRAGYRVLRGTEIVPLTPKLLDLLLYLVDHAGELVTKEALLDSIWPDANVTDNALAQAISELRQALGDDSSSPKFIKTVARRGYRFIGAISSSDNVVKASVSGSRAALDPKTVAVLDFTNVTGDADTAWLGAGIAETVTADLRAIGDFKVIDRRRVRDAARRVGDSFEAIAQDVRAGLAVVGSFQRLGPRIRITARLVNVDSGEALADAKVDGPLDTIFGLQDQIVVQMAAELGIVVHHTTGSRIGARETESLDAFRAFTEGWLHLETLSVDALQKAAAQFDKALTFDHRYALAHTGLASAKFALYETTRSDNEPAADLLRDAIEHARHGVALDEGLAEAHATLAMALVSDWKTVEAIAEARQAVALEPANWRHHFRLGDAAWGEERLRAGEATLAHYPGFAFAHFQIAMVHIARGHLEVADTVLRKGATVQDRQRDRRERFPALGLHWLRGLTRLAEDDVQGALAEFDHEVTLADVNRLYGREYAMHARHARGMALLRATRPTEAISEFEHALALYPEHARTHLGLALAHRALKRDADANAAIARGDLALSTLTRGRPIDASLVRAARLTTAGRSAEACQALLNMLKEAPPGFAGWTIPIEPLFRDLLQDPAFTVVQKVLADRAA